MAWIILTNKEGIMAISINELRINNIVFLKEGNAMKAVCVTNIKDNHVDVKYLDENDCFIPLCDISPNQLEPIRLISSSLQYFGFKEVESLHCKDGSEYTTFKLVKENNVTTVVKTDNYHILRTVNGLEKLDKHTLYLHELQNIINYNNDITIDAFHELTKKYSIRINL